MINSRSEIKQFLLHDIRVFYRDQLDGGGTTFGQEYIPFIRENLGTVRRVFEWCAGPGFIGFSLLANGLCETLCLSDVNPHAVELCKRTVEINKLEAQVSVYLSNCLDDIPASEKWDLVIGNPPHSRSLRLHPSWGPRILYMDFRWRLHRRFYEDVKFFMQPQGNVIIQENRQLSSPSDFHKMIIDGGLKIRGAHDCPNYTKYYFFWSGL